MIKLSKEEKQLLESYEKGGWRSVKNLNTQKPKYASMARETLKKNKRVNIRISERVLQGIQKKAMEEGIPYQTLMASILHKYVSGRLHEK